MAPATRKPGEPIPEGVSVTMKRGVKITYERTGNRVVGQYEHPNGAITFKSRTFTNLDNTYARQKKHK